MTKDGWAGFRDTAEALANYERHRAANGLPPRPKAKPAEPLDTRAVGGFVQNSPRFVRGT